jgi:predicted secreted hydrolase
LKTASGKEYGFELVFFKRRTDLDKFSLVPVRLLGNPIYFAHFALTGHENKSFKYSHRKSANGMMDIPAEYSEEHYFLRLGDWSVREADGAHILSANISGDIIFHANLKPSKRVALNGKSGEGVSFKDEGEASRYFSYTRMDMEGDLVISGKTEHFNGSAWMDREFGTWEPTENQKGWDWFSIHQLRNEKNEVSPFSSGTFIDEAGNFSHLTKDDFTISPTGYWKSPRSNATYPSGWKLSLPKYGLELEVIPVIEDQELDTRGTTMIVYWEGACTVKGSASGKAYVELVGYDRSHDNPNLAYFLMGNSFRS